MSEERLLQRLVDHHNGEDGHDMNDPCWRDAYAALAAAQPATLDVELPLPRLPETEVLGELLHDAVHPKHPWSGCGRPDDVYLWVGRFRASFDLLAHKPREYDKATP